MISRGSVREGYLVKSPPKESALFAKWQRRWVVLSRMRGRWMLRYYKDATSVKEKGCIVGSECLQVSRVQGHPKSEHLFALLTTKRRYLFAARTKAEMDQWVGDLSEKFHRTARDLEVCWEYQSSEGVWCSYGCQEHEKLEHMYQENAKTFEMKRRESVAQLQVVVDLGQMTESDKKGGGIRKIQRRLKQTGAKGSLLSKNCNYMWLWMSDSGKWEPYPRTQSNHIEIMYQAQAPIFAIDVITSDNMLQSVLINFGNCEQINPVTGKRRGMQRQRKDASMTRQVKHQDAHPSLQHLEAEHQLTEPNTYTEKQTLSRKSASIQTELSKYAISHDDIDLQEELGQGAFGEVFKGIAQNIPGHNQPKVVAVKVLKGEANELSSVQMTEFLKEAQVMAKFDHPNVISLLAVCLSEEPIMLLSDYMNCGDLLNYVRQCGVELQIVVKLSLAKQIADGMQYLSIEKNFVHRDLAARNVLVNKGDDSLTAKITDFGLSRDLYSSQVYQIHFDSNKEVRLPAKWMAIESLETYVFTTKSDVWGYGVVLWEIFTNGLQPYPYIENRHMLHELRRGLRLDCPQDCPINIYHVICECCRHSPEDRPDFIWLADRLAEVRDNWTVDPTCYYNVDYELPEKQCFVPVREPVLAGNLAHKQPICGTLSIDKPKQKPKLRPKPVSTTSSSVSNARTQECLRSHSGDARQLPKASKSSLFVHTSPGKKEICLTGEEDTHPSSLPMSEMRTRLSVPTEEQQTEEQSGGNNSVGSPSPTVPRRFPWKMTSPSLVDIQSGPDLEKLSIGQLKSILRERGEDERGSEKDLRSKVADLLVASHRRNPGGPYHVANVMNKELDQLHSEEDIKGLSGLEVRRILRKCSVELDGSDDDRTLTTRLVRLWLDYSNPTASVYELGDPFN